MKATSRDLGDFGSQSRPELETSGVRDFLFFRVGPFVQGRTWDIYTALQLTTFKKKHFKKHNI